jgi:hypothetical protein
MSCGNPVLTDDCGAQPDQRVDGPGIRIDQIDVEAVLRALGFSNPVEVPRRLRPARIRSADRRELGICPWIQRATQGLGPEVGDGEHVMTVDRDVRNLGDHAVILTPVAATGD